MNKLITSIITNIIMVFVLSVFVAIGAYLTKREN